MIIHVAQSGRMYEVDSQGSTLVHVIQTALASLTGVPASDQMLICGDVKLDASKPLSAYQLPSDTARVFLFNRASLLPDSPVTADEEIEEVAVNIPLAPSVLDVGHPLDESLNPLLRALPSYERQFKYHLQKGQALFQASQQRYAICRRLVQEQQVQQMALQTACGNMGVYYRHICSSHHEFMDEFHRHHAQHSDLLSFFERDMDRLRSSELHPSLQTLKPLRRTLIDCLKEPELRKWGHDCTISHTLFASKVGELAVMFRDLEHSVERLLHTPPAVDVHQLHARVEDSHKYIEEQGSIVQSLSKDFGTVKKLVEDCVSGRLSTSLRPLDACAALDPMSTNHEATHLPRVEWCGAKLASLLRQVASCKSTMTTSLHSHFQSVAALQSTIRDLRNQGVVFKEAMARQREIFSELALVRNVSSSYTACLAEVVRRKAFGEVYVGKAGALAEELGAVREEEVGRREEFVASHCPRYLPKDVIHNMGLFEMPTTCQVSIPRGDVTLLDVDMGYLAQRMPTILAPPPPPQPPGAKEKGSLETAWLRAELASTVATLCSMQQQQQGEEGTVAEALRLKDEYAEQLRCALTHQTEVCAVYEERMKRVEEQLREAGRRGEGEGSEVSGMTMTGREGTAEAEEEREVWAEPSDAYWGGGQGAMEAEGSVGGEEKEEEEEKEKEKVRAEVEAGMAGEQEAMRGRMAEMEKEVRADVETEVGRRVEASVAERAEAQRAGWEREIAALKTKLEMEAARQMEEWAEGDGRQGGASEEDALRAEVRRKGELLSECEVNCAHLEKRLHEAVEEVRRTRAGANAADKRRGEEVGRMKKDTVALRGFLEWLHKIMGGGPSSKELREVGAAMQKAVGEAQGPSAKWGPEAVRVLVDHILALKLAADAQIEKMRKGLEASEEVVKAVRGMQDHTPNRPNLSFTTFQVPDLAAFVATPSGDAYVAINHNCPHLYLSPDSVALFKQQRGREGGRAQVIVGQIVHIERSVAGGEGGGNPYKLPHGTQYSVVTLALVPEDTSSAEG